jgi:hypothetical protein
MQTVQIELIGCTSAGKSSLAQKILNVDRQNGLNLAGSYDFVLRWAHLDWLRPHPARMLALNLIALGACLYTWRRNLAFYRFVTGAIRKLPPEVLTAEKLKIARIAARNLGIFEIVRRNSSDGQVILADEGTLHIAHYLFVHVSAAPDLKDLETFIGLAPIPDAAVYLKQPETVLTGRTRMRGHKRIPANAPALVERFIQNSVAVFEWLAECPSLEGRLLIMEGEEGLRTPWGAPENPQLEFARQIVEPGIDPIYASVGEMP